MPVPSQPPLSDDSRRILGIGVLAHFASRYPYHAPSAQIQILDVMEAHGTQRKAAQAIGVSDRTLRRWANGATPTPANLAKLEKAHRSKAVRDVVFVNHLQANGFTPSTTIQALLYQAIKDGHTSPEELGAVLADFMVRGGVPETLVVHTPPTFDAGMYVLNPGMECTISEDDDRGDWPFNIGSYA